MITVAVPRPVFATSPFFYKSVAGDRNYRRRRKMEMVQGMVKVMAVVWAMVTATHNLHFYLPTLDGINLNII